IPALVKRSVGSPWGTSEELRTRRWPLLSKKRRNISRISLPVIFVLSGGVMGSESPRRPESGRSGRQCKTDDYGRGREGRQRKRSKWKRSKRRGPPLGFFRKCGF